GAADAGGPGRPVREEGRLGVGASRVAPLRRGPPAQDRGDEEVGISPGAADRGIPQGAGGIAGSRGRVVGSGGSAVRGGRADGGGRGERPGGGEAPGLRAGASDSRQGLRGAEEARRSSGRMGGRAATGSRQRLRE